MMTQRKYKLRKYTRIKYSDDVNDMLLPVFITTCFYTNGINHPSYGSLRSADLPSARPFGIQRFNNSRITFGYFGTLKYTRFKNFLQDVMANVPWNHQTKSDDENRKTSVILCVFSVKLRDAENHRASTENISSWAGRSQNQSLLSVSYQRKRVWKAHRNGFRRVLINLKTLWNGFRSVLTNFISTSERLPKDINELENTLERLPNGINKYLKHIGTASDVY